jgi:Family of unknown function (DUF5990)
MTRRTPPERTIRLRLTCEEPPASPGIEFGLQDRSGALQPGMTEPDGSLRFEADIRAVALEDGTLSLRGLIVHGPPTARFLYLSCRTATGRDAPWIFRLKVPLAGIDGVADAVEARVRASGGGTVALLGSGWTSRPGPGVNPR